MISIIGRIATEKTEDYEDVIMFEGHVIREGGEKSFVVGSLNAVMRSCLPTICLSHDFAPTVSFAITRL